MKMGGNTPHRAQQQCVIDQAVAAPATASCTSSSSSTKLCSSNNCSTNCSSSSAGGSVHEGLYGSNTSSRCNSSSGSSTPLLPAVPQNSAMSSTMCNSSSGSSIPNVPFCLGASTAAAAADTCYCKLLVSNHLAGIIIGQAGNEIRTLKSLTGAKIVLSPHGMYFPGTSERVAALEGPETSVLHVLDWLLDKLAVASEEVASAIPPQQQQEQEKNHQQEEQQQPQQQQPAAVSLRLCVPRAVVGSLIGRSGGYIQSLRIATGASINISPLFVRAEEACAERIISIESRKAQSLRAAAFTLLKKINTHPDKASCRHVCYYRKHSFDSPLADAVAAATTSSAAGGAGAAAAAPNAEFRLRQLQQNKHREQQQQVLQQHLQQQREREMMRRRAISLVMGNSNAANLLDMHTSSSSSSSSSSSNSNIAAPAEDGFAVAFKRFCEARATAKAASKNAPPAAASAAAAGEVPMKTAPSLTRSMREVIEQSRSTCKGAAAAAATVAAVAAPAEAAAAPVGTEAAAAATAGKGPDAPWDLATCSTAAGSTDKLPTVSEDSSSTAEAEALRQQQQQQPSLTLLVLVAVFLAALLHIVSRN
ncbi:KH domain-containing protein, putative [Eimeria mitis]|uniref:KH domain-containing protein, putative n=1 Tax=Eimeria mitis TaxID=44415 RepID=U6KGJ1_9EIME|nr:KH domain-containing protein, putative [Eimeria mitis]CDJ35347.1 KH domain-containing protein, putative [Eimeria mitis]